MSDRTLYVLLHTGEVRYARPEAGKTRDVEEAGVWTMEEVREFGLEGGWVVVPADVALTVAEAATRLAHEDALEYGVKKLERRARGLGSEARSRRWEASGS